MISKQLRPTRDVEWSSNRRQLLAKIPAEQAGVLERVICAVRDAPIFEEEGGYLSVHVSVETPAGESLPLCSFRKETGRVRGDGCSVDVDLWLRTKAAPGT